MAPERLEGNDYDGRADVYSVGVLLYEMLSGQVPFGDRDQGFLKIAHNHLHAQPVPLHKHRPDLSEAMAALVLRAISRDPQQRPTAQQLRDELLTVSEWEAPESSAGPARDESAAPGDCYISVPSAAAAELAEQWNADESDAFVRITEDYPRVKT